MAKAQELLYAVVGAGDFAFERARNLTDRRTTTEAYVRVYNDFVTRGRTLSTKIKGSAPTKQAIAQTKTARTQAKAAATSAGKALGANARAARSAANKTAKAS